MKQQNKNTKVNMFFSAFLMIAYVICAYFFSNFAMGLGATAGSIINILVFVIFGLLVFYATRVGDGKALKRFSLITLIVLDLPALYIIIASLATGLPFGTEIAGNPAILPLAAVALGYGIPYTFLSGFELVSEDADNVIVEGGVKSDVMENTNEEVTEQTAGDSPAQESVVYTVSEEDSETLAEQDAIDGDSAGEVLTVSEEKE